MEQQIQQLTENEAFMKALVEIKTPEELAVLFKENDIAIEDGMSIDEAFQYVKSQQTDELSEADLESASGGVIGLLTGIGAVGAFTLAGGALAFLGGYAYQKYKNWKR